MDPLSMEGNTESINSSHGRSIENPHLSHIEKRRAMHPKNRIDIIDNSCLNDFQSTAWAFFSGMFRPIRYIGFFINRQRIDITANSNNRLFPSPYFCDYPRFQRKV